MNDLPSVTLIQQSKASPKTGEELETLGKEAAAHYFTTGDDLTVSVIETVKKAGLSPEQVRRVAEFANTEAFLREFKKEGSTHRVIEFEGGPADVSIILKDLNDGGGGTVFDKGDGDYAAPPPDVEKTASVNMDRLGHFDAELQRAFGVEQPNIPFAEPLRDAYDMKHKIAGVYDELQSELSALETMHLDVCDSLYNEVKQASLGGLPLGDMLRAWQTSTTEPVFVKVAFQMLTPRLVGEEVFSSKTGIAESLEKTAAVGLVNPEHPLVTKYQDFCDNLSKMAQIRAVCDDELAPSLDTLNTFLKQAAEKTAGKAETVGKYVRKGLEAVPKAWKGATEATAKAAPKVETALGGGRLGKVVGTGVKYSPHIGAGLVAEEAYSRAKYNPTAVAVKNMLMSRIPYTHPYMVRQYQYQMGG
jgi:hypothetical protein